MKYLVFFLNIVLFLFSCENMKNKDMQHIVSEWDGKEIKFPSNLKFTMYGDSVVEYDISSSEYKIVSYTDSIGCTSCKLRLSDWKEFIKHLDSVSAQKIPVLFFLHPLNNREMKLILKQNNFEHPVCLDKKDEFNKLNTLPHDLKFQTFLLDKFNRVVVIGNPVLNPNIKELYINRILKGKPIQEHYSIKTTVEVDRKIIDLGCFDSREKKHEIVNLKNSGKNKLIILDVVTSCGCTIAEYNRQPTDIGKSVALKISYKADHPEHFNKTVVVYCNTDDSPIVLQVKGDAK